jgi:biopolymer transport protein ExbD
MAGGASFDNEDRDITEINVTPLVDVVLVLLIIFMVTANYIVSQSIQIQLPKADTGQSTQTTKNLAFVLDKAGELYLDGKPVKLEDVVARIQKERGENPQIQLQALVAADQATPHGYVVRLIDTVRKNGITDLAINVEAAAP